VRAHLVFGFTCLVTMGCGGSRARNQAYDPSVPVAVHRPSSASDPPERLAAAGSSDGTTCEQAREQYVEEINVQAGGPADLQAADFAAVLNSGGYLGPCDVPSASKVRICAAVQNGLALGVTVALDPPSSEVEVCVAGQVRRLSFPASAKMDIVNVTF
jgi:hypothetical protein